VRLGKNCQIYCVPASVTAIGLIGGPRARHAVLLRGTPNSDDFFPYRIPTPHALRFIGILYLQLQCCTQQWVNDMGARLWRRLRCIGNVFPDIFASGIWREFWRVRNFGLFWNSPPSGAEYWPRLWHHPIRSIIDLRLQYWR
jgi:hypothetical protein